MDGVRCTEPKRKQTDLYMDMEGENAMKSNFRPWLLAITVVIPLSIGGISAMLTGDMMKEYFFLNKPPLSPPSWVFPIVWSILYVMMGVTSYLVINSGADRTLIIRALILYGIQLVLNFFWSILFFRYSLYIWAFIELIAMWGVVIATAVLFFRAARPAGILMIPYVLWLTFAAYLNYAVYKLSIMPMALPK